MDRKYAKLLTVLALCMLLSLLVAGCTERAGEPPAGEPEPQAEEAVPAVPDALEAPEEPDAPEPPEPVEEAPVVSTDDYVTLRTVNVRSAPGLTSEVITSLPARTHVEVTESDETWTAVLYDSEIRYIASEYLHKVEPTDNGLVVVIDAGHQAHGNSAQEPIGPGATQTKNKVTGGTRGTTTGIYEYELNLDVSLLLRDELEARGYTVLMTRTTHDVDISNSERAAIANDARADAFVRIHANGSDSAATNGALTICQTRDNPFNGDLYETSYRLSAVVLDALVEATGCNKEHVWETDTMSGINWCTVPTTIVEMGYMTNPDEDRLLATDEYRAKIVQGVANGLDAFFDRT